MATSWMIVAQLVIVAGADASVAGSQRALSLLATSAGRGRPSLAKIGTTGCHEQTVAVQDQYSQGVAKHCSLGTEREGHSLPPNASIYAVAVYVDKMVRRLALR